jgi:transcriptional regulator with XRE-family HTH domain
MTNEMANRDTLAGLAALRRAAREKAGLSQAEAAELSGVHFINLSKFENDKSTPTLATLYKLAEAYGVNVCDLLPDGVKPGKGKK